MQVEILQANATALPLRTSSVDLVIGSPPYCDARTYGISAQRNCTQWVDWMLDVTREALRVCRGPVLWVAAGTGNYWPACEGLMWEAHRNGVQVLRPCIWTKNAPPTGKGWFSNEWEFVMAFQRPGATRHFDPTEIATPLKYKAGGAFRQRGKDGARKAGGKYPTHTHRKRPGNVFHVTVGGGHLGSAIAHENEAPYPEKLVEPFIATLSRPGDTVLDPFCGSGTTAKVAVSLGRNAVASDIRESQCELVRRRIEAFNATRSQNDAVTIVHVRDRVRHSGSVCDHRQRGDNV